jgi:hypothetical protein
MKQTANGWMLFKFHLSAFLSAARSITLVMQKKSMLARRVLKAGTSASKKK